jgi:hypothetical protein
VSCVLWRGLGSCGKTGEPRLCLEVQKQLAHQVLGFEKCPTANWHMITWDGAHIGPKWEYYQLRVFAYGVCVDASLGDTTLISQVKSLACINLKIRSIVMPEMKVETVADQLSDDQAANIAELIAAIGDDPTFSGHDAATC